MISDTKNVCKRTHSNDQVAESEELRPPNIEDSHVPSAPTKATKYDRNFVHANYSKLPAAAKNAGLRLRNECRLLDLKAYVEVPTGEVSHRYGVEENGKRYALSVSNAGCFFEHINGNLWKDHVLAFLVPRLRILNDKALKQLLSECERVHPEWIKEKPKTPVEILEKLPGNMERVRVTVCETWEILQLEYLLDKDGQVTLKESRVLLEGPSGYHRMKGMSGTTPLVEEFNNLIHKYKPLLSKKGDMK